MTSTTKNRSKKTLEIKKPVFLFEKTQTALSSLSAKLGCPVLTYFKPPSGGIWSQDLYALAECVKMLGKQKKLAFYIRSNGGQGMVSLRIINLLRSFADEIIILIPSECNSAATMLALGCDEIHMGPLSTLSPVDSSLTHSLSPVDKHNMSTPVSLDELGRVLKLWKEASVGKNGYTNRQSSLEDKFEFGYKKDDKTSSNDKKDVSVNDNPYKYLYDYIHPLVFGAVDRYSSLSVKLCKEILGYHMKDENLIDQISNHLNYEYPSHGYPITMKEAKKIGLNIKGIDDETFGLIHNLQSLYNQLTEDCLTDYDNQTYHDNTIYSVIETESIQLTYQQNYDKFYRESEKRYYIINDDSGWYQTKSETKKTKSTKKPYTTSKIFF